MSTQNLFMMVVGFVLLYGIYQTNVLRKRIRCRYSSRSKQTYEKLVKSGSHYVIFEGKKFYILPHCVTHHWYNKGISQLFPTFMPEVAFTWQSPYPVDPNTGNPTMLSPEVEHMLDQEGALASYAGSQQKAVMGKNKVGGMEKWLPWIAVGVAVLVGIYVYTMNQDMNTIKKTISDLWNKVGY